MTIQFQNIEIRNCKLFQLLTNRPAISIAILRGSQRLCRNMWQSDKCICYIRRVSLLVYIKQCHRCLTLKHVCLVDVNLYSKRGSTKQTCTDETTRPLINPTIERYWKMVLL